MNQNSQSRKWNLVINNPHDCNLTHDVLTGILKQFSLEYFCLCDEIASTGTYHTHIFLYSLSPIRFQTIKNRFPTAHIEKAYGTAVENKKYILKDGKWKNSDKSETSVEGSFLEYGNLPSEKEEKNPKMYRLIEMVKNGASITEVIDCMPNYAFRIREIEILRQTFLSAKYATEYRKLNVYYIFGASGTGKTRGIYERHHPNDICRITNYRTGKGISFDGYSGHDVLVFEEFNSQVPIEEMLNFLDIYPLLLPARYTDKVACYTTSNQPLHRQYKTVQSNSFETWKAFLRRIHKTIEYRQDGSTIELLTSEGGLYDKQK